MDRAPFAEATALLRETLELLATEPTPESVLPALWAYATAARRLGMTDAALETHFRALYDAAHQWRPGDVIWDLRRERLVRALLGEGPPLSGYLTTE